MAIQNSLNLTATGIVSADGSGVYNGRTITAGDGVSITNGDGTAGNPTITTTAIGNGSPNYVENLGIKLDTGVFSIVSADATDISASNPAYVSVPSTVTPGTWIMHQLTDNYQFVDDNGTSTVAGMLWGTTTAVDWGEDMPFYIYAISKDDDSDVAFGISRSPAMTEAYASANIGVRGAVVTTNQNSLFLLDLETGPTSPTVGDYDGNPAVLLGAFRMHKTSGASNDWTVQTISDSDGIGKFHWETFFVMPTGVNGSASGTYCQATTGTRPTWSSNNVRYYMHRSGLTHVVHEHNGLSNTPSGAGEFQLTLPAAAVTGHDAIEMMTTASGTVTPYWGTMNAVVYFSSFKASGSSTALTNANIAFDVTVVETVPLFA